MFIASAVQRVIDYACPFSVYRQVNKRVKLPALRAFIRQLAASKRCLVEGPAVLMEAQRDVRVLAWQEQGIASDSGCLMFLKQFLTCQLRHLPVT